MKKATRHSATLLSQLRNELTEAAVYTSLAKLQKDPANRELLERIGADEAHHARIIEDILGHGAAPSSLKVS